MDVLSVKPTLKVTNSLSNTFFGKNVRLRAKFPSKSISSAKTLVVRASEAPAEERYRLNNLAPQPGSRRPAKRKGRGIAAGQGASCGFGMRGQNSRSGPNVRPGFEGGQMPLYRRLPKLKGIAGGMGAGLSKYVTVNLEQIDALELGDGALVNLEILKVLGVVNPSGRERKLPLKILGDGDVKAKLTIEAGAFSASAKEKLETAGCTLVTLPGRKKFLPASALKRKERTDAFFAKKREAEA